VKDKHLSEGEKFATVLMQLESLNLSIPALTLLIREIAGMIALKSTFRDAITSKEIEKLKGPRTVDEFLASLTKGGKKK
jgi:hypothetical protein